MARTKQTARGKPPPVPELTPISKEAMKHMDAQRNRYANAFLARCQEWHQGKQSALTATAHATAAVDSINRRSMHLWDWSLDVTTGTRNADRFRYNDSFRVAQCGHIDKAGLKQQWMATSLMGTSVDGNGSDAEGEKLPVIQVEEIRPLPPDLDETRLQDDQYEEQDRNYQVYTKDQVWFWKNTKSIRSLRAVDASIPAYVCPIPPPVGLNPHILAATGTVAPNAMRHHGGVSGQCNVWTLQCPELVPVLKPLLDKEAERTMDTPMPRYHNIIDPNLCVRKQFSANVTGQQRDTMVWVPSEFDVSTNGDSVSLVGGDRAHWMTSTADAASTATAADNLIDAVATPVLQQALPLLSQLRKPCLLLEGQRLQVAVKAQRIVLPPAKDDNDPSEYVGLWHVDGEHEAVAAVVLYYYNVHEALQGGNMEFVDRAPIDVFSDSSPLIRKQRWHNMVRNDPNPQHEVQPSYSAALTGETSSLHHCSVPIQTGQMLVFSNYQLAHRVLRMINTSTTEAASRDFVALFVLDPATRPLVPARCHLSVPYMYERTLGGNMRRPRATTQQDDGQDSSGSPSFKRTKRSSGAVPEEETLRLNKQCIQNILEFLGLVPTISQRLKTRQAMLLSQLQPKGGLCGSLSSVYTTGNGCYTMVGWFKNMLEENEHEDFEYDHIRDDFGTVHKRVLALNRTPKALGRGLSETLSIPTDTLTDLWPQSDEDE